MCVCLSVLSCALLPCHDRKGDARNQTTIEQWPNELTVYSPCHCQQQQQQGSHTQTCPFEANDYLMITTTIGTVEPGDHAPG